MINFAGMERRERAIFIGLGIAALLGASVVAWIVLGPTQWIKVTVRNAGRRPIAAIRLEHEGGVETAGRLETGASRTIRFRARGETSYTLRVRFDDGSELAAGRYAESGYKVRETVGDSKIESETSLIDLFGW